MKSFSLRVVVFCYLGTLSLVTGYTKFGRKAFPSDFVFGLGSAAYQYEGATREDGKGQSIWDTFAHIPGKIVDSSNGDVAVDQYHRYKDDVKLLADLGVDSYRFSIAWTRIFPNGRGKVNKKGIAYYNNLIDELIKHGIRPFVTIFHWDLPQALQDEYGGFLSEKIIKDFVNYADICFKEFGDRVKHWVTINELISVSVYGYNYGSLAPGRCSKAVGNCSAGNSAIETYIVTHNLLLSHAAAVKLYRDKYQKTQKGSIGITIVTHWFLPHSNSLTDGKASRRALDFFFGWYIDPLTRGEYPATMRAILGARLPRFTQAQSNAVKGSFDFLGINYYTGMYVIHDSSIQNPMNNNFTQDARAKLVYERNGILIGPQQKGMTTWAKWISSNIDYRRSRVFFRGMSPKHYSPSEWNEANGHRCYNEREPVKIKGYRPPQPSQVSIIKQVLKETRFPVALLDITRLSQFRKDGHSSVYTSDLNAEQRKDPDRFADCSHWCLPGVPDTWNELLYAHLL